MAIRQRGKTWTITIERGFDSKTGKRHRDIITFTGTKKQALAEEARLKMERDRGTYVAPSKLTFGQFLQDYWLIKVKSETKPRTEEGYRQIVESHLEPALGHIKLDKLRPIHLQEYINAKRNPEDGKKPLSGQTLKNHYSVLRQSLKYALHLQLLAVNPADRIDSPRAERVEREVLDEKQTVLLLRKAQGTELYVPICIAAFTGLRRGEVLGLKWSDLDWDNQTLQVVRTLQKSKDGFRWGEPKSQKSRRTIAVSEWLISVLREHRRAQNERRLGLGADYQDQDLICAREYGDPWEPSRFSTLFHDLVSGLDLPEITFHGLRHGHLTHLLKAGLPANVVSARAGHSTISITVDLYGHILEGQDRAAANAFEEVMDHAFKELA